MDYHDEMTAKPTKDVRPCMADALDRVEKCAARLGDVYQSIERLADAIGGPTPREVQSMEEAEPPSSGINDRAYRIVSRMERRLDAIGEAIRRTEQALHG